MGATHNLEQMANTVIFYTDVQATACTGSQHVFLHLDLLAVGSVSMVNLEAAQTKMKHHVLEHVISMGCTSVLNVKAAIGHKGEHGSLHLTLSYASI